MKAYTQARRVSAGTLFKLLFVGAVAFHVASTLLVSALVLFGWLPTEANESISASPISSYLALAAYLVAGLIFSPLWVGVLWLTVWPGLWLYSLVKPMRIGYVPEPGNRAPAAGD